MPLKVYFLDKDQNYHWYLIQSKFRKEWEEWKNLDEEDPRAQDLPEFAKMINSPKQVEFCLKEDVFGE